MAETRAALLEAAIVVVSERGYAETTIARVAEQAGVALGTLYNHFDNLRALLLEALIFASERFRTTVAEKVEQVSPELDTEVARFLAALEVMRAQPGYARLMREIQVFEPEAWRTYAQTTIVGAADRMRGSFGPELEAHSDDDLRFLNAVLNAVAGTMIEVLSGFDFDEARCEQMAKLYARFVRSDLLAPLDQK